MSAPRATARQKRALAALAAAIGATDAKSVFALIRAQSDEELLRLAGAASEPKRPAAQRRRRVDPLVAALAALLKPILGPASEKGELLIAHIQGDDALEGLRVRGLADAARHLRKTMSDAAILAAAETMMSEISDRYSMRETVV